jgi:enolase-phosphatase E1
MSEAHPEPPHGDPGAGEGPVRVILTDIEGTTSAIAFVKDTLFPFAAAELDAFLDARAADPAVAAILAEVPGPEPRATLRHWMDQDAKVTPLKALQGMIWRAGFEDGRLRGHLWPDVAACLRAWSDAGLTLAVYSSGSEEAQRLLFRHSLAGDLEPLFAGFFDTRTGPKRAAHSYAAIARKLGARERETLFLSDVGEELDAAAAAGLLTCQLIRPEDGTQPGRRHPEARDFPAVARRFGLPAAPLAPG